MGARREACEVCGGPTLLLGARRGKWRPRDYEVRQCPRCWFGFVADPDTDYANIYNADYYAGRGADPLIDYEYEWSHPRSTIRRYEWEGLGRTIGALVPLGPSTHWLDFGCGTGHIVRWMAARHGCQIVGHDAGYIAEVARGRGVPILDEAALASHAGRFDVITALDVLEHVLDPLAVLRRLHALLRPGGVLFFTTGNARPWRARLPQWSYVLPEIHISFYEPGTLALALERAGFRVEPGGFGPGFSAIMKTRILKNLGVRRRHAAFGLLPWPLVARLAEARYGFGAFPIGRRPA